MTQSPGQPTTHRREIAGTLALIALGAALASILILWRSWSRASAFNDHLPGVIIGGLVAGAVYLAAVWVVDRLRLGTVALLIVIAGALAFRALLLPLRPELSEDVYRYQWEGRVQRAGANPYEVYPAMPDLRRLQDPRHPIRTGEFTPTVYPPLSEGLFALVRTVAGYKRLFTSLDVASFGVILLLLATLKQPLTRSLVYAWNPAVIVSFALSGHHDSLAILALLLANVFLLTRKPLVAAAWLALGVLAKLFPLVLLPVFIKRIRQRQALSSAVFICVVIIAMLPYAGAGRRLFRGLSDYAAGWEANDSLFRLFLLAGNSKAQAEWVAGVLVLVLLAYTLQRPTEPLRASLVLIAGLLFVSPNAFPWYFTWFIPFLCFELNRPLLLLSVTAFLAYAPVIPYSAGLPYRHAPLLLGLEYAPVYAWLALEGGRRLRSSSGGPPMGA